MQANPGRYTAIDEAIAGEVRAEFARNREKSITELAAVLGYRRATLSARLNGHQPFTAGQLQLVAEYLGTTVTAILTAAEERAEESVAASAQRTALAS